MKYFYFIALIAVVGCKSPLTKQQKAEQLVKLHLDSTTNDPQSYQSIKFEKLDTLYSSYRNDPNYRAMQAKVVSGLDSMKIIKVQMGAASSRSQAQSLEIKALSVFYTAKKEAHARDSIKKNFKPKPAGWKIMHSYRAKNSFGALTTNKTTFYFDKNLTRVDSSFALKN